MLKVFTKFLKNLTKAKIDNNWGYSTDKQKRFTEGTNLIISDHKNELDIRFPIGCDVWIIENARHDYLVRNKNGEQTILYQYEITAKK